MADSTKIEWADATWNPVRGCSRVSRGCMNCYAERVAHRFSGPGQPYEGVIARGGMWNGRIRLVPDRLEDPWRWQRPRRVFVNSMSDLFHPAIPMQYVDRIFAIMAGAPQHQFQILTKRPAELRAYFDSVTDAGPVHERIPSLTLSMLSRSKMARMAPSLGEWYRWPLPNVWIGVSVEDQATADERIPQLLATPAAVRWISAEPLLGPIWLRWWQCACGVSMSQTVYDANGGNCRHCGLEAGLLWERWPLDWVVAGGESGPGARAAHPDWFRSLRDQCQYVPAWAGGSRLTGDPIPFLFKQWGEWGPAPGAIGATKAIMAANGHIRPNGAESLYDDDCIMARSGKKRAGRELDGMLWEQYPEPRAVAS